MRTKARFLFLAAMIFALAPPMLSGQQVSINGHGNGHGWGKGGKPKPSPTPIADGETLWNGSVSTNFNDAANWTHVSGAQPPGTGDVAWFTASPSLKSVNLSSSVSISGLYFNGTDASGYDITSSGGAAFTLTATSNSTGSLTETGDTTANAIRADNTSGTNTIEAAIILGSSTNASTIVQASGGTLVINGLISGSGKSLAIAGGGTVELTATNTYNGTTTINTSTTLVLGNATDTLADTSLIDVAGGTLSLGSNSDTVAGVTLEAGGNITGSGTLTVSNGGSFQILSGTVSANLAGTNVDLVKFTSGGATLTGTNTYDGGTFLFGGELRFNNVNALGTGTIKLGPNSLDSMSLMSTTTVSLPNNITVDLGGVSGRTATLGSFAISASGTNAYTGNIVLNSTLNIESSSVSSNPLTFSGVISDGGDTSNGGAGSGGLNINPSGTLSPGAVQLSGNNTYSGGTTLNAGTLLVTGGSTSIANESATGTGNVTVSGSGTYLVGGSTGGTTGTILGSVSVGSGSHLSPGTSGDGTSTTAILHTGALTLSSGSFFNVNINGTTAGSGYDQVVTSGMINISGSLSLNIGGSLSIGDKFFILENTSSNLNLGTFSNAPATITSGSYTFDVNYLDIANGDLIANDVSLTVVAIPEAQTWISSALAMILLIVSQSSRARAILLSRLRNPVSGARLP